MSTLKTNNIQHVDRSDPSILINTDGSVSIAGTMTYEDVTSVDSVGIITGREIINAQKQVHVGTGVSVKAGGLNVTAGISTFGQGLIMTSGIGTFLAGTSIDVRGNFVSNAGVSTFTSDVSIADKIVHSGDTDTAIRFPSADTVTVETGGSERFRVASDGDVIIGGSSDAGYPNYADNLTIHGTGNEGITIRTGTTHQGAIYFSDATGSGTGTYEGSLIYDHNSNYMTLATNHVERMRIDSSGRLIVGATSSNNVGGFGGAALQVEGLTASTSAFSIIRHSADTVGSSILMGKSRGTSDGATTVVQSGDVVARIIAYGADGTDTESSLGAIQFDVDGTPGGNDMPGRIVFSTTPDGSSTYSEAARITNGGQVRIGNANNLALWGQNNRLQVAGIDWPTSGITIAKMANSTATPNLVMGSSRGSTPGTAISNGDRLGYIAFVGDDGTDMNTVGAAIVAGTDAAPSSNSIPGVIQFYTGGNSDERMRITSSGSLNIGNASGYTKLIDISKASATDTEVQIRPNDGNAGEARLFIGGGGTNQNKCAIIYDPAGGYCRGDLHICMENSADTTDVDSTDKKLSVAPTGDVTIHDGNLKIGTSGHGIDFSATSNASGMSSELFDDYEEGTWTVTSPGTISSQISARYTKIGRMVHYAFYINMGSMTSTASFAIGGLPFTTGNASQYYYGTGRIQNATFVTLQIDANSNTGLIYVSGGTTLKYNTASSNYVLLSGVYEAT